jgi:hypothetical protein
LEDYAMGIPSYLQHTGFHTRLVLVGACGNIGGGLACCSKCILTYEGSFAQNVSFRLDGAGHESAAPAFSVLLPNLNSMTASDNAHHFRRHQDGQQMEPLEEVTLEINEDQAGGVIEALTGRKGDLHEMAPVEFHKAASSSSSNGCDENNSSSSSSGRMRLVFEVPSRGMIGFKSLFANMTRGEGLLQRAFSRCVDYLGTETR